MSEKNVILYSSKNCPRCKALKQWLRRNNLSFDEKNIANTDVMTDLVMRNITVLSAPALETENKFWLSHEIFDTNNRLTSTLKNFMRDERT